MHAGDKCFDNLVVVNGKCQKQPKCKKRQCARSAGMCKMGVCGSSGCEVTNAEDGSVCGKGKNKGTCQAGVCDKGPSCVVADTMTGADCCEGVHCSSYCLAHRFHLTLPVE